MENYKSEVRQSELDDLKEKVAKQSYGKYLRKVVLKRVRGFTDREVVFEFPVTALVGPNGGGKTTILGAAAIIHESVPPGRFFAKSGKYDESMTAWTIEYELTDKKLNPKLSIQRTASFAKFKWNRKPVERETLIFGVSRTLPATERKELTKAVGAAFSASTETELPEEVVTEVGKILGKTIKGFNKLSVDAQGRVTLFAAKPPTGAGYSEFHFGAGEASVIKIVSAIEASSVGCLILIEEIENGLHPVATRRLVEYLIRVATRKSAQVVFTTHSNDALAPLPSTAIWAAYNGQVLQGKLDIKALRTITGQIDAKLAIFVEDKAAEMMVLTALRYLGGVEIDAVRIHYMGGEGPARAVNEQHNLDPTAKFKSICILDGDQGEHLDPTKGVFLLPGTGAPEAHVFERVHAKIEAVAARLAVAMQLSVAHQERVATSVKNRAITNTDRHVIFEQIGEDLDFTSGMTVAGAFYAIWAQEYPDEVDALVTPFMAQLPKK